MGPLHRKKMKKNVNLENPLTLIVSSAECFCRSAILNGAVLVVVVVVAGRRFYLLYHHWHST